MPRQLPIKAVQRRLQHANSLADEIMNAYPETLAAELQSECEVSGVKRLIRVASIAILAAICVFALLAFRGCNSEPAFAQDRIAVAGWPTTSQVQSCDASAAIAHISPTTVARLKARAPRDGYSIEPMGLIWWDDGLRTPRLTLHEIDEETIHGDASREGQDFFADPSIDSRWRTHPGWFTNTGDDRFHCIPCGDLKYSQPLMNACMTMKNIQVGARYLNEHPWANLEKAIRSYAGENVRVTIATGPCWQCESKPIAKARVVHGMVAGTHCFKAILIEREDQETKQVTKECRAWCAENVDYFYDSDGPGHKKGDPIPRQFNDWEISTHALEVIAGFNFWPNLSVKESKELEGSR